MEPLNGSDPVWRNIPAGSFLMGSNGKGSPFWPHTLPGECYDEAPVRKVHITEPFQISATPVTNRQYEAFDPAHREKRGTSGYSTGDDEPVVMITHDEATAYCDWLTERLGGLCRLPTEAEWEYACRAGSNMAYSMDDALPSVYHRNQRNMALKDHSGAWLAGAEERLDLTVGQTPPNAFGLHDMHGWVEEWCRDWYAPYPPGEQWDPAGPLDGEFRVTRGGSHSTPVQYLRSANRMALFPEARSWLVGFRVVRSTIPPPQPRATVPVTIPAISLNPARWQTPAQSTPLFDAPIPFIREPDPTSNVPFYAHHHVPSLTWCDNGDLLVVWFSAHDENGREMIIYGSRLPAGSGEWSTPYPFYKVPDRNMSCAQLFNDGHGRLLHLNGVGIAGTECCQTLILRESFDCGVTWSRARLLTGRFGGWQFPVTGTLLTSRGWFVQPVERGISNGGGMSVMISKDNGATWHDAGSGTPDPARPGDFFRNGGNGGRIAGIHAAVEELTDGRWMALGRCDNLENEQGLQRMPMSLSEDQGRTWTYSSSEFPPVDGGQRIVLKRLREGPLLLVSFTHHPYRLMNELRGMTFRDASSHPYTGYGMFGALSYDDGRTWPVKKLMTDGIHRVLEGGAWTGFFEMDATHAEPRGYLSVTQTPDQIIHLVSSRNYYRFNVDWLTGKIGA